MLVLLIFVSPALVVTQPIQSVCTAATQREALLEFYNSTSGPQWTRAKNWGNQNGGCKIAEVGQDSSSISVPDHCCWEGVICCSGERCPALYKTAAECDCQAGRVTRLQLRWNGLRGEFPIKALSKLNCAQDFRRLELQNNGLNGEHRLDDSSLGDKRLVVSVWCRRHFFCFLAQTKWVMCRNSP